MCNCHEPSKVQNSLLPNPGWNCGFPLALYARTICIPPCTGGPRATLKNQNQCFFFFTVGRFAVPGIWPHRPCRPCGDPVLRLPALPPAYGGHKTLLRITTPVPGRGFISLLPILTWFTTKIHGPEPCFGPPREKTKKEITQRFPPPKFDEPPACDPSGGGLAAYVFPRPAPPNHRTKPYNPTFQT